jgi:hypothetical protein
VRQDLSHIPDARRPVCVEVFAGSGHLAKALEAKGFYTERWDILLSPAHDFTSPVAFGRLLAQLKTWHAAGRLHFVHFGVPCTSFSAALFWSGHLRSKDFPWGLSDLSADKQDKLEIANTIVRNSLTMLKWLISVNVCVSVENPSTSKLWYIEEFKAWINLGRLSLVDVDYCQFGQPWRKRTRFLFSASMNASTLERLCKGHKGLCSRTKLPHIQLQGKLNGVNRTKLAEPYPRQLCHRIAHLVFLQYHYRVVSRLQTLTS